MSFLIGGKCILGDVVAPRKKKARRAVAKAALARSLLTAAAKERPPEPEPEPEGPPPFSPRHHHHILQYLPKQHAGRLRRHGASARRLKAEAEAAAANVPVLAAYRAATPDPVAPPARLPARIARLRTALEEALVAAEPSAADKRRHQLVTGRQHVAGRARDQIGHGLKVQSPVPLPICFTHSPCALAGASNRSGGSGHRQADSVTRGCCKASSLEYHLGKNQTATAEAEAALVKAEGELMGLADRVVEDEAGLAEVDAALELLRRSARDWQCGGCLTTHASAPPRVPLSKEDAMSGKLEHVVVVECGVSDPHPARAGFCEMSRGDDSDSAPVRARSPSGPNCRPALWCAPSPSDSIRHQRHRPPAHTAAISQTSAAARGRSLRWRMPAGMHRRTRSWRRSGSTRRAVRDDCYNSLADLKRRRVGRLGWE